MARVFYAKDTIFEAFVQERLCEHAHKPLAGSVLGLSQVFVQYGPGVHVQ